MMVWFFQATIFYFGLAATRIRECFGLVEVCFKTGDCVKLILFTVVYATIGPIKGEI